MIVLHNALIHTLDEARPRASTIAIHAAEIVGVGDTELLDQYANAQTQDLRGRVVLPGLIDAHLHLQHYAVSLQLINCETDDLGTCLRRVEQRVHESRPDVWVRGHGWNQNTWGSWPTAADLDGIAPANPVFLTAKSLHAAWANSAALRLAGIHAGTPDPPDGRIQRDAQGAPTGILLEGAAALVSQLIPEPGLTELVDMLDAAQAALWKLGLTGVHDFDRRDCFMALQQLHAEGRLRLRVVKSIPAELLRQAAELGLRSGFGDDWLRIGSVKAFMDGALGPRTAAMIRAYDGEPDNNGILQMDGEQLFDLGRQAADAGLSMAVHAIGDRANHEALDAFEQLREYETQRDLPHLRHRIEHVQLLHPDDVRRLAGSGIIASMQPLHATSDMRMADQFWGERSRLAYAWKSQLDLGAHLAFGSDAPVESPDPFRGIHAAVTRRHANGEPGPNGWYPEQRLSVQQAIEAYTVGPAYAAHAENRQGRLAPGFAADLILLEKDPFRCDPDELIDLECSATMVGGKWVHES